MKKLFYKVPEAVQSTGIGRSRLYEYMRTGELESVTVGRSRLIPAEALEDFARRLVESQREAA